MHLSIEVLPDYTWQAKFCGYPLNRSSLLLRSMPELLTCPKDIGNLLSLFNSTASHVCIGNDNVRFLTLVDSRGGKLHNPTSESCLLYLFNI